MTQIYFLLTQKINSEIEFSKNEIKCSNLFSSVGYESKQCATSKNDEVKLNLNWSENTLNDYLYPTEGINNSLTAGIALPLGDYEYFNLNADHTSYRPVTDTTTLKISGSDKQLVGVVASKIKTLRKIEPYKGKGVREKGQYVLKKEGKKK